MRQRRTVCSLCDRAYSGYGNNAAPFEGRCCDECDDLFVVPIRMLNIPLDSGIGKLFTRFIMLGNQQRKLRVLSNQMHQKGSL